MIIDVNAYIGHYPFRRLKYKTAADLIGQMDKYGIDKSCAAPLNAVYYKDCMEGNYELLEEIAPYKDRLIPFCVINPEYNGAREDFELCVNKLGFKGLRLFPKQQDYKLDGELAVQMLRMAGAMNIPVHIPILLEDLRGHHPLDAATPVSAEEIKQAAILAPDADIILSNDYLDQYARIIEPACAGRPGKIYYDISRVDCIIFEGIQSLVKQIGYERLVFGTGALLQNIPVQFVKLHYMTPIMGATAEQLELIKSVNLAGLLGI